MEGKEGGRACPAFDARKKDDKGFFKRHIKIKSAARYDLLHLSPTPASPAASPGSSHPCNNNSFTRILAPLH